MSEQTEGRTVIAASAAEIMDVLTNFEAYPEWAEVTSVRVLERGDGGLGTKVAFEVEVPVLGRASYTLAYRYAPGDGGMSWVSTEARGAVSDISGSTCSPRPTRTRRRSPTDCASSSGSCCRGSSARRVRNA